MVEFRKEENSFSVWISYSRNDRDFASKLIGDLLPHVPNVWTSELVVDVGESIEIAIAEGISKSDFFLLLLSSNSASSQWVLSELYLALARREKTWSPVIVPIVIERGVEIPPMISDIAYIDLSSEEDYEHELKHLIYRLEKLATAPDRKTGLKSRIDYLLAQEYGIQRDRYIHALQFSLQEVALRAHLFRYLQGVFLLSTLALVAFFVWQGSFLTAGGLAAIITSLIAGAAGGLSISRLLHTTGNSFEHEEIKRLVSAKERLLQPYIDELVELEQFDADRQATRAKPQAAEGDLNEK